MKYNDKIIHDKCAGTARIGCDAGIGRVRPCRGAPLSPLPVGPGNCLRFNKTTGSVAGAVGGGLLGHAIIGGPGGLLVGAAAGGLAGHELAHNRRKRY